LKQDQKQTVASVARDSSAPDTPVRPGRGGARKGAGRPLLGREPKLRYNVMLTPDIARRAGKLGRAKSSSGKWRDNVSAGIEIAIKRAR